MHIYAPGSTLTLCGAKPDKREFLPWLMNKATCVPCLIRNDAMLTRGWPQTKWHVWFNGNRYNAFTDADYKKYGARNLPRNSRYFVIEGWDAETLRNARRLAKIGPKLGICDMSYEEPK